MKLAVSALLALSLIGGVVEAQSKKVAAKRSARTASKKQTTAKLPAKKVEAAPAPVIEAAPVAAQPNTSTASMQTTVAPAQPKRWGVLVDIWAEGQVHGMNRAQSVKPSERSVGKEDMENSIQIRPSYKITDTASVAAGIDLVHSFGSAKGDDDGQFKALDAFLQVAHSKMATVGPLNIKGYLRPYIPTSEGSQDPVKGRYAAVRAGLTAAAPLGGGLELSYNLEPRYFFQKNMSYLSKGKWENTEHYRLKHWVGLGLEAGKFTAYQNLGLRHQIYHDDTDADTGATLSTPQKDQLYLETAVGYQIVDNFALNGGVYTESNDFRNNNGWTFYNDQEYLYFVEGVVTF